MIKELIAKLKERNLTLGSVESITGGLFASEITCISGASKVYKGGIVSYTNDVKINVVGVSEATIKEYGAVSEETAKEMANEGRKLLKTDIVISFTGNAGPDVLEKKPVGIVYVGIRYKDKIDLFHLKLCGNRREIQSEAVNFAIEKLLKIVKE